MGPTPRKVLSSRDVRLGRGGLSLVSSLNTKVPGDAFRLSGSYTLEVPTCRGLSGSKKHPQRYPLNGLRGSNPLVLRAPHVHGPRSGQPSGLSGSDRACRSFLLVSAKPVTSRPRRKAGPARPAGAEGFRRLPTAAKQTLSIHQAQIASDSCLAWAKSKKQARCCECSRGVLACHSIAPRDARFYSLRAGWHSLRAEGAQKPPKQFERCF